MKHQKQVKILSELLRQLDHNVNVDAGVILRNPTSVYTCPDIASREWGKFFQNHPQLIGLYSLIYFVIQPNHPNRLHLIHPLYL